MLIALRSVVLVCLPLLVLGRPFISYAALGDSYATGDGAYPSQVARGLTLAFKNLAQPGSFIRTVLKLQVPWVGDSDIVSVQVGGNEADFFELLNECIQQWRPISTCESEIAKAQGIIESSSFIATYDNLISETRSRLKPDAVLLVLGYARFFNDKTEQCNHATFSRTDPNNFLTQEKRRTFNRIVSMLNTVVKSAAEAHGASYIDIDKVFDGHRFCEDGVIEPAPDASWFYNDIETPLYEGRVQHTDQTVVPYSTNGFLDLARTFHPTIEGHAAIANTMIQFLHNIQHQGVL